MGKPGSLKPTGKAEPRFDLDYSYGRQGELLIGDFLKWIADGNGQVEVKRKRYLDLEFYVETHCDKGRQGVFADSGISVTTAKAWAFVIGDTGISVIVPTDELKAMIDDASAKDKTETDGSCPTRGKLINLAVLLYRHKQKLNPPTPLPAAPVTTSVDAANGYTAKYLADLDAYNARERARKATG